MVVVIPLTLVVHKAAENSFLRNHIPLSFAARKLSFKMI